MFQLISLLGQNVIGDDEDEEADIFTISQASKSKTASKPLKAKTSSKPKAPAKTVAKKAPAKKSTMDLDSDASVNLSDDKSIASDAEAAPRTRVARGAKKATAYKGLTCALERSHIY